MKLSKKEFLESYAKQKLIESKYVPLYEKLDRPPDYIASFCRVESSGADDIIFTQGFRCEFRHVNGGVLDNFTLISCVEFIDDDGVLLDEKDIKTIRKGRVAIWNLFRDSDYYKSIYPAQNGSRAYLMAGSIRIASLEIISSPVR